MKNQQQRGQAVIFRRGEKRRKERKKSSLATRTTQIGRLRRGAYKMIFLDAGRRWMRNSKCASTYHTLGRVTHAPTVFYFLLFSCVVKRLNFPSTYDIITKKNLDKKREKPLETNFNLIVSINMLFISLCFFSYYFLYPMKYQNALIWHDNDVKTIVKIQKWLLTLVLIFFFIPNVF